MAAPRFSRAHNTRASRAWTSCYPTTNLTNTHMYGTYAHAHVSTTGWQEQQHGGCWAFSSSPQPWHSSTRFLPRLAARSSGRPRRRRPPSHYCPGPRRSRPCLWCSSWRVGRDCRRWARSSPTSRRCVLLDGGLARLAKPSIRQSDDFRPVSDVQAVTVRTYIQCRATTAAP